MKLVNNKAVSVLASCVALLSLGGTASAASLNYDGAIFTTAVAGSGANYTLTMEMDFTGADAGNEFLGDMMEAWSLRIPGAATSTLTGFQVKNTATNTSTTPAHSWVVYNSAQADASGCGNGNTNSICVDWFTKNVLDGTGPLITDDLIFTFSFTVVFDSETDFFGNGNFHLLSVVADKCPGNNNTAVCYKKDGGLISEPLLGDDNDGDDNDVPEPGTLALLGLGLIGLGLSRRRRV